MDNDEAENAGDKIPSLLVEEEPEVEVDRQYNNDNDPILALDQLEQFRQRWREELLVNGGIHGNPNSLSHEEKEAEAKQLFMIGCRLEQEGELYEAIKFYRRAMHLVPDIENKMDFSTRSPRQRQESETSIDSYDGDELESDLITKFTMCNMEEEQQICTPKHTQRACHISALPVEVLMYIFKWVITSQLDMISLENISQVCRGFYLFARDEELWRLASTRIWGSGSCKNKLKKYGGWRQMYIERPHLQFVGCYISKMSYARQGEKSLDNFYSPWHQVAYYRYIRFFSEGVVLMMTSPDDPQLHVAKMKSQTNKVNGMMKGIYRISGNRVTGQLKHVKLPETTSYYKYKRNKNQTGHEQKQTFNIELEIKNVGKKNGYKLVWIKYSVNTCYKGSTDENVAEFEINSKNYPPLLFSPVKSFNTGSESILRL